MKIKDVNKMLINSFSKFVKRFFRRAMFQFAELALVLFLLLFGLTATIINPNFISITNLINIMRGAVFIFIVGIGATFVLICGQIDLSVGSNLAFSGLIGAYVMVSGVPISLAILIAIGSSLFIGLFNGFMVIRFKIPALIVTLGMMYIGRGLVLVLTKGATTSSLPESFLAIAQSEFFGIPVLIIYAIALGIIFHIILTYTKYGYHVRAVGGNSIAAKVSGINVNRIIFSVYLISGLLSGVAGVLLTSRLSVGTPNMGVGFEMYVIAAVIIGGCSLFGGMGSIVGAFLGSFLLSAMQNGMVLMKISPYWQNVVIGGVMIAAVGIDQYRRSKMWQIG